MAENKSCCTCKYYARLKVKDTVIDSEKMGACCRDGFVVNNPKSCYCHAYASGGNGDGNS